MLGLNREPRGTDDTVIQGDCGKESGTIALGR